MNPSSKKVLRYLVGKENIEDISISELQNLADENPYFPVAQFLLAKKLKSENDAHFLPQLQKTALYFSNPFWFHYQLSDEAIVNELSDVNESSDEKISTGSSSIIEEMRPNEAARAIDESAVNTVNIEDKEKKGRETSEQLVEEQVESINITYLKSGTNAEAENIENVSQPEEEVAALVPEPDKDIEVFLDELDTVVQESLYNKNEDVLQENGTPAEQEAYAQVLEEMAGVTHETDDVTEAFLNETQSSPEENAEPPLPASIEPDEHERMFQNIKAMLDASSEEADADIEDSVIPIDPYYTIDYFASQGIKLELDQNPNDQLGQHLKKFTQWLKHMKKLGPEDATEVITRTDNEADIQKIAESSNTVREVVTEAMASVLEKQGKNDKAIELYRKLSFLNPDKSAYFATKIKNLKGI
ncbi:hypothetical protein [Segetibacter koreensis]|uniref:hypothetical protein n=1 Tax=Segetibacter koreensis TaxID=398037 RepID=UPI00037ED696|nr:hypothetical protein [Segetibacter koreensis]